jgi:hypothetical protein
VSGVVPDPGATEEVTEGAAVVPGEGTRAVEEGEAEGGTEIAIAVATTIAVAVAVAVVIIPSTLLTITAVPVQEVQEVQEAVLHSMLPCMAVEAGTAAAAVAAISVLRTKNSTPEPPRSTEVVIVGPGVWVEIRLVLYLLPQCLQVAASALEMRNLKLRQCSMQ